MHNELPVAVGDEIHSAGGVSVVAEIDRWIDGTPVATLVDIGTAWRRAAPPVTVPVSLIALTMACGALTVVRDPIAGVAA